MEFSPYDSQFWDDPYPAYQNLRDRETLHYSGEANAFCVTRHDEAAAVFKQPEVFASNGGFGSITMQNWGKLGPRDVMEMLRFLVRARLNPLELRGAPKTIITSDPPDHAPLRNIVNRGFTPRRIADWESRVRELSEGYVRGLQDSARFDAVERLAHPLPMTVIAEMLGVDPARRADFRRWSNGLIDAVTGGGRTSSPGALLATAGELLQYLRSVVDQRRQNLGDDLISVMIDPTHGEPLDTQAVMLFATILLVAGNETTTNCVGNTVDMLLRDRALLAEVSQNPSLIPALVEESIRLESPFRFMPRQAVQDTMIRNTMIRKGSNILIMIGSANRDERVFEDPDRLNLRRDTSAHLGFGYGSHFCLGASLARLEVRVALETLLPLLQDREIGAGGRVRADSFFTRGFKKLEVSRIAARVAA